LVLSEIKILVDVGIDREPTLAVKSARIFFDLRAFIPALLAKRDNLGRKIAREGLN
jgi:hypothetical protein